MILQNKEQFIRYIPTAAASDWRDMETFRDSAERWLKNEILGRVLYEELEADAEREQYQELSDLCCKVISLDAYHRAIPFLDLVQNANGFGVVSNQNLAPASRERVNRLIQETALQRDDETEVLLDYLEDTPAFHDSWKGSKAYSVLSDCLVMTARELKRLCKWSGSREEFLKLKPMLTLQMYSVLGRWVSRAYIDELLEQQRDNDVTEENAGVLNMLKFALANYVTGNLKDADDFRDEAVSLMDARPEAYPTYANSKEYRTRHQNNYENSADSPIYIMGGI